MKHTCDKEKGQEIKTCPQYVGVACIDGSCPVANREEYAERGIPTIKNCKECWCNKGCEDCSLDGTEHCKKAGTEVNGKKKAGENGASAERKEYRMVEELKGVCIKVAEEKQEYVFLVDETDKEKTIEVLKKAASDYANQNEERDFGYFLGKRMVDANMSYDMYSLN